MSEPPDCSSRGQELGGVLAPHVILNLHADADDAGSADLRRLRLHPGERELSGFVDALRELRHLLVLPGLPQALHDRLVRDVVHAGAKHESDKHGAGGQKPEEILSGKV